jgi:flagellar hook-associated protein 3 FlgL
MKTTQISTQAISDATRLSRMRLQLQLSEGQKEATTGRLADVGQGLGYLTGRSVSLRQDLDRLNTFKDTNAIATTRLKQTQTALEGIADLAQQFISTLVGARASAASAEVAVADARTKLIALTSAMNNAANGAFLFAGINTDVKPFTDYFETPTPANRAAVATEFTSAFGLAQGDPGTELITSTDRKAFLDGPYSALFDSTNWTATWSSASDRNITSRINNNELIETSANANNSGIRLLASAYTMVADLGAETLSQDAFQAIVDKAIAVTGEAIGDLTQLRAALGTSEERIDTSNNRMSLQITIMTEHVNLLEGVDPFEASSRVNALLTQVETAYALTARLQRLSLINYL